MYFTALKCTESADDSIARKCEQLSNSKFLQLEYIKTVHLCFAYTNINFDLSFLQNKKISLLCNNCVLLNGINMPTNISEISLTDCQIETRLDLPGNIDTVIFKNVITSNDIAIDDKVRHIELINVTGNINIKDVKNDFQIKKYNTNWSFERIKKDKDTIKILLMGNIVFKMKTSSLAKILMNSF